MEKLNELTTKELSAIASELGLTLSYKAEDGKRKRFTKDELIANIEYKQFEDNASVAEKQVVEKAVETTVNKKEALKINNSNMYGISSTNGSETLLEKINLNTVIKEVKCLLVSNEVERVKFIISELQSMIKSERRNKLLVRNMSNKLNIIKSLFKTYSKKSFN